MRDERSEHFASRHVVRARIHGSFPSAQSWHVHCEVCTCALVAEHHGEHMWCGLWADDLCGTVSWMCDVLRVEMSAACVVPTGLCL